MGQWGRSRICKAFVKLTTAVADTAVAAGTAVDTGAAKGIGT